MANSKGKARGVKEISTKPAVHTPRSLAISERGIRTGSDFANLMSALMSDLIDGSISPGVGTATVNAGGKLLQVVHMTLKYGKADGGRSERKTLVLTA